MAIPIVPLLIGGALAGGLSAAAPKVGNALQKIPIVGPLLGPMARGAGELTAAALPGLMVQGR